MSYQSLVSTIANLDADSQALHNSAANCPPVFLSDVEAYTAWRYYATLSLPSSSKVCPHGRCVPSRATHANLARARRAFHSLLHGLVALSQTNSRAKERFVSGGRNDSSALERLIRHQAPYARAFAQLDAAVAMFVADMVEPDCGCFSSQAAERTAAAAEALVDALHLFRAACYLIFYSPPGCSVTAGTAPLQVDTVPSSLWRAALSQR